MAGFRCRMFRNVGKTFLVENQMRFWTVFGGALRCNLVNFTKTPLYSTVSFSLCSGSSRSMASTSGLTGLVLFDLADLLMLEILGSELMRRRRKTPSYFVCTAKVGHCRTWLKLGSILWGSTFLSVYGKRRKETEIVLYLNEMTAPSERRVSVQALRRMKFTVLIHRVSQKL